MASNNWKAFSSLLDEASILVARGLLVPAALTTALADLLDLLATVRDRYGPPR